MNFVIETFQPTAKYATASSLINALGWYGFNTFVWNRQKPFLDMLDECNPHCIFTYGLSEKEMEYCYDKVVRVVNINDLITYVPDILLYNPSVKNDLFKTSCICLADYVDTDDINCNSLNTMISTSRTGETFKFFSIMNHPRSYGMVPLNMRGQALASADSVMAISEVGKANAVLCNNNVRIHFTTIDAVLELRKNYIEMSNLFAVEEFVDLNENAKMARINFINEVFN